MDIWVLYTLAPANVMIKFEIVFNMYIGYFMSVLKLDKFLPNTPWKPTEFNYISPHFMSCSAQIMYCIPICKLIKFCLMLC